MIRFAILAGVSTDPQAKKDKLSIPDQIAYCRQKIAANEGIETTKPYIMDGYSRTGYDSLADAMNDIPPLAEAIRAAQENKYDVLIMDNFDRLGDLGLMVSTRFKKFKKQLYSARQSGKLQPPDQYDPYSTEADDIDMYVQGIIQRYRINKIRRGWRTGVPARAENGLHPLTIPFGYKARGKGEPAEQIPEQVKLILQMKDWYLEGKPVQTICNLADQSGITPRRAHGWQRMVVERILHNPYYAGQTIFGKSRSEGGTRLPLPPSKWTIGQGKHQPLWDQSTYFAILAETERRNGRRDRPHTYTLTGLLSCSVCGAKLHRHGSKSFHYLYCRDPRSHIRLRYELALELTASAIIKAIEAKRNEPSSANAIDYQTQIKGQNELRARVQEGFETKLYTALEAHKRITEIEKEIERLKRKQAEALQQTEQKKALLAFAEQDLHRLHDWILHDDPTTVNRLLTALCETVIITPKRHLTVVFR